MSERLSAAELLALVTDDGSFSAWDSDVVSTDPLSFTDRMPYRDRLAIASDRATFGEAVIAGQARIRGHDVAVVVGDFAFLAGTVGVAAGERVVRAFERARERRLPVVTMPASGGTRMQEGALAFAQMIKTAQAVRRYRDAGGFHVAYLRHPTTGGVLASWGSLAQVTFAAPGALIGLTGPRVVEQVHGDPLPPEVQTAENLARHGLVDDLVEPAGLAERVARLLAVVRAANGAAQDGASPGAVTMPGETPPTGWSHPRSETPAVDTRVTDTDTDTGTGTGSVDAWAAVEASRHRERPGLPALLERCATHVTFLRGDGTGRDDPGCMLALARLQGRSVVVAGHHRDGRGAGLDAAGHRMARRGMRLATELGLPLVSVIDTAGAQMTRASEEGGNAWEIARCLATLTGLAVPTVAVLLGEGSGGGALALLPADRVLAAQHAWLAPISPEAASTILYRSADRAAELARAQAIAAPDLARMGVVDTLVAERPAAHAEPEAFLDRLAVAVAQALAEVAAMDPTERLAAREARWRGIGLDALARRG